ncbi:MAG: hypothetical protein DRP42_01845 [Tenericutes bacterium]|nr:MAG: hypothetical protein DRP42_01845 [Mycoplasmatota bacterium]
MSNYKSTFGVEIHLELNTNTKAFSSSPVSTTMEPNTAISPTDLAYPGTKPRLNKKVVEHAFKLATLLKMDIADVLHFDRKNYIYPDLSKGFQITQFYNPIGKKGIFTIINQDGVKKEIQITEIHIEEDTAKQVKLSGGKIGFDFNRAGVALIEIVTGHEDFETIEEVTQFVEQFRQLALLLNISNCKFEDGSIRTDINVSVSNTTELGNRVEIKNLNSISNMRDALKFEIDSQIKTIESGSTVEVVTKRFDEATRQTVFMRNKESITDYNYFPEANILPINIVSFKEQ